METSADKNSAGVLSLWHCILTRFYAVSSNKDGEGTPNEEETRAMIDIYRHMRHLRLAVHEVDNPDFISIPEIAKPFNSIVSGMPEEKWIEELRSLMREVVTMQDILKDVKEVLYITDITKFSTLENDNQPKNLIYLLTVWYWLAAWSSLDQPENRSAKDEFIQAIEAQGKMLGYLLVDTSPIQPNEQQELQILFSKLLQMLKSDPQLWTGVLNRFINTMLSTPETLVTPPMQLSIVNANNPLCIGLGSFLGKLGKGLLKEGAKTLALEGFMKVVKDGVGKTLDDIKDAAESVYDEAKDIGKKIVQEVENLAETVGKGVQSLADDTKELAGKVADEVENFGKKVAEGVGKAIPS